jgi:hypothetical protein
MTKRDRYLKELNMITVHCFDLMKYRLNAESLNMSVWVNFRGEIFYSGDILVEPSGFGTWNGHEWVMKNNLEVVKTRGIQQILDHLEVNYEEKIVIKR